MPALACQPVSVSESLKSLARTRALPAASVLLAAVLSACAPLPSSTEGEIATSGKVADSQVGARAGAEMLARIAPLPVHPDRLFDPVPAVEEALEALEWPEVDQRGVASWYGPRFHGRKTANGERYNQYELTAAHRKYAFNTQLCVRNTVNGKTVVVRVNDRGPYVGNRVIDLSKAAAEEIGMLEKGVKRVEIYKLEKGEDVCPEALLAASN